MPPLHFISSFTLAIRAAAGVPRRQAIARPLALHFPNVGRSPVLADTVLSSGAAPKPGGLRTAECTRAAVDVMHRCAAAPPWRRELPSPTPPRGRGEWTVRPVVHSALLVPLVVHRVYINFAL